MTILNIDGQILDYREYSQGETPVIFLHGILMSHPIWLDFPERFSEYGRVISLSLPGHYPARFAPGFRQEQLTGQWVGDTLGQAIAELTGGRPALLIGHSTGGYAALAIAWRRPELVRQVVSIAGFARGRWTGLLGIAQHYQYLGWVGDRLFDTQLRLALSSPLVFERTWRQTSYDKSGFAASQFHQQLPEIMEQAQLLDIEAARFWFYQMYRRADLTPHLKHVQAPVLTIAGRQDSLVPPTQAPHIANHVRNGVFKLLDGMDHASYVEQPVRVKAVIDEWLASPLAKSI